MTVYISGPITGTTDYEERFSKRADELKAAGYEVCNPVVLSRSLEMKLGRPVKYEEYIKNDIRELLRCDAISMLPGWENSRGANLEVSIAEAINLKIVEYRRCGKKNE